MSASYGFFSILDSQTLKAIHKIEIDKKPLAILVTAAWQPTGQFIAVGDVYGVVRVYTADTLEPVAEFSVSDQPQIDVRQGWFNKSVISLSFSADGASLFTVTTDGTMQTWRVQDFTRISNETLGVLMADAAWSPYQGRLAYALRPQVISESTNVRTVASGNLSEIQILVPAPFLDRLNAIAELCDASLQPIDSLNALPDFVAQVESLPEGTIPAACRADLLAVADALR